jgi:S-adenosylmethionine synthetase
MLSARCERFLSSGEVTHFTSESVSEGHPDKVADQISDAILDETLRVDSEARVACETLVKTGLVVIAGEITVRPEARIRMKSYPEIAREVIREIGYDDATTGFHYGSVGVIQALEQQSPDISMGVDESATHEMGAGDQGMMFGYAVDETPELMPATIQTAHKILQRLSSCRRERKVDFLRPDAKSQVTVEYCNGRISHIDTVVVSTMHSADVPMKRLREFVIEEVVKPTLPAELIDARTKYLINPTGRFVVGGPQGDCGLTGRKIIVDSYGGHGAHGGGAFSGKDPTKVDRSAAYLARYIAKNLVAAGMAKRVLVQLAYAIGVPEPVSVFVECYGTETIPRARIERAVIEVFPMKPREIIELFSLRNPTKVGFSYRETAAYGHFGRPHFPWERTDRVAELQARM